MSDTVTPEELEQRLKAGNPPQVLDVRRRTDRESDSALIPGAEWKDPEQVGEWGAAITSSEVVVYCARGGSVSRSVQESLRRKNIDVTFIEGGLEAWKRSGRSVVKP